MWYRIQSRYAPYLFISPFLMLFGLFWAYPLMQSLRLSFYATSGPGSQVYIGLDNFRFLLSDPDFHLAVWNTLIYAFFVVAVQLPLSLGLAVLLNRPGLRLRNVFRFVFFSPHLMGTVFASVLFGLIFAPRFGVFNRVLHLMVGLPMNTRWLGDAELVMPAIIILSLWLNVGFYMIYLLAALQGVRQDLYEAARVDGAGAWTRFLHVTLPGIWPVLLFVLVISTIGAFRIFELPWLLLQSTTGPDQSGLFIVTYLYQNGFEAADLGYASAIGWLLTAGVMGLTLIQLKVGGLSRGGDS